MSQTKTADILLPPKLCDVFIGDCRYRGAYGGRGSGKTRSFALMCAVRGVMFAESGYTGSILCAREFVNTLEESSIKEVKQAIQSIPWLAAYYEVGEKFIRTRNRRVDFVFTGLRRNIDSIKSKARILLAWVDEAEAVPEVAWKKLIPTVRETNSEIWITWNPETDGSPTDYRFCKNPPESSKIVEINYHGNPWFPDVLDYERREDLRRMDSATYAHVWEGAYLENSDAQVLNGKVHVDAFEPGDDWDGPYFGMDYGFANDPTAATKSWVFAGDLYIEQEVGGVGIELDDTAALVKTRMPEAVKYKIRADNARPELSSYLRRNGLPRVESAPKWQGSVYDGIQYLRNFKRIIVHPRCTETIWETRNYKYKTDRLTGDILPDIIDANNHYIDSIRYAHSPMIGGTKGGIWAALND